MPNEWKHEPQEHAERVERLYDQIEAGEQVSVPDRWLDVFDMSRFQIPGEMRVSNREITSHRVNGCNESLTIEAIGDPGPGGANQHYQIHGGDPEKKSIAEFVHCDIRFQQGNPAEAINGVTQEALLAIIKDRLEGFQSGPFANEYNAKALMHVRLAMTALQKRTEERVARGVEGTLEK